MAHHTILSTASVLARSLSLSIGLACLGWAADASAQPASQPMRGMGSGMSASGAMGSAMTADQKFMMKAAAGGMAEVELSTVAQQNASSDQVKQFAGKMVDDHTKANDELKQIASAQNVQLPTRLDAKHQKAKERLEKMSGAQFDKVYINMMVADHKETVALFQSESRSGKNPDAKAFAAKTLPTIQEHTKMAQMITSGMNGRMGMSNSMAASTASR